MSMFKQKGTDMIIKSTYHAFNFAAMENTNTQKKKDRIRRSIARRSGGIVQRCFIH